MAELVDADVRRREVIASAWTAAALSEPLGRWLLDPPDRQVACDLPIMAVGASEPSVMQGMQSLTCVSWRLELLTDDELGRC